MAAELLISIDSHIHLSCHSVPYWLFQRIDAELTLPNPQYQKAIKHGYSTRSMPPELRLYTFDGKHLCLPRGFGPKLLKLLKEMQIEYRLEDRRRLLPEVEFNCRINLREYQKPAAAALVKYRQGGVVAGCGAGKTQVLLQAMAEIRQPSLWICHTRELLNQTRERAVEFLGLKREEIGVIAAGEVKLGKKLTIALVQSLNRLDLGKLSGHFGAVFVDEAHHLAANTFFNTVGSFPARYRLWASATPQRADGLTGMVYACGGPVLYTICRDALPVIVPRLVVMETAYASPETVYSRLIADLFQNEARNRLIVQRIAREAPGNFSLVLSERVEHLQHLKNMLKIAAPRLRTEILTGRMSKGRRDNVMQMVQQKDIDLLLATQLAREGLDIVHLNRLFLTVPKRAAGALEQEVGRIMRRCEGKKDAVVFDFWDVNSPVLKAQFWPRREAYKKLGISFNPGCVIRNS